MKKILLLVPVLTLLSFGICTVKQAAAQGSPSVQQVGLIDMAYVFKNYKKFKASRELLKAEIQKSDAEMKGMAEQIKSIQNKLRSGTYKKDSPEYIAMEKKLVDLTAQFTGVQKNKQREFLRKESKIYKEIYLEVTGWVGKLAEARGYSLIIRFNREGVEPELAPQQVLSKMNRQVVYYNKDIDITEEIVEFMNKRYQQTAAGGRKTRTN